MKVPDRADVSSPRRARRRAARPARWLPWLGCGLLLVGLVASWFRHRVPTAAEKRGFLQASVRAGARSTPYALFLPRGYSPAEQWPVILFLHGYGERGNDGWYQTLSGLGTELRRHPERFPCLVVLPQTRSPRWEGDANRLALRALDAVVHRYHGDPQRLYLTGESMGGAGCWRMAAAHPALFAAVLPICGRGRPREMAPALKSLPIWVFQGGADPIVPPQCAREMVAAIRDAGNRRLRYTEYPGLGHDAWSRTYADPQVIAWLFAQKRPAAGENAKAARPGARAKARQGAPQTNTKTRRHEGHEGAK
jgi:poly(3-hydroxybutyrate) depolymerase